MSARRPLGRREALSELLARAGLQQSTRDVEQLDRFAGLLEKWGARINLTGSTAWGALRPLFEEALWAAARYPSGPISHLDVGSGGGFPAIPLRVLRPEMTLVMVETRTKRAFFLETVVQTLDLDRCEVHALPVEDFVARDPRRWDVVSWKALRMSAPALSALTARLAARGELWLFHGRELPLAAPEALVSDYEPVSRERVPSRDHSFLSRYRRHD